MSSNSSDTDESDGFASLDDLYEIEGCFIHPILERDIQLAKQYLPKETITDRILENIGEVDIKMAVDLGFIERSILDAWGLCQELPLTLQLTASTDCSSYDKNFFQIEIFQGPTKKQTAVLMQLKNIAVAYMDQYFSQPSQEPKEAVKSEIDGKESEEESSSGTKGFLVQLHGKIQDRLQSLNGHCPICDRPHGDTSMWKPAVCARPLCIFSSQTMGVMCQVTDALQTQPEVVKLLIALTHAAASCARYRLVLLPFPDLMESDTRDFIFMREVHGILLLRKVMDHLIQETFSETLCESEVIELLNSRHKYCYALLRWIISSNRSHVLYIPLEKQMEIMETKKQFLLRNSPPAEDALFRSLAKKHGSCFAFHGSPIENWHSIIRKGLVIASGTSLELNGAACGKGIYLTPLLKTALAYAERGMRKQAKAKAQFYESFLSESLASLNSIPPPDEATAETKRLTPTYMCVALCEVITCPKLKKKQADVWLVEDSQHVCTRFFFLYKQDFKPSGPVDTISGEFESIVKTVLADI